MLFDITKLSDKIEAMTDFIPLFKVNINKHTNEGILYVNKNTIKAFVYTKQDDKECLVLKCDTPREYIICKEDNPVAFNELFKGYPEKISTSNIPFK